MHRGPALAGMFAAAAMLFGQVQAATGTWGATPETPADDLTQPGQPPFTSQSFNNQTVRQIVRISAGGTSVQVRLSNEFGTTPLIVGETHVALAGANGAIVAGSDRRATFLGRTSVTIAAGKAVVSDAVALTVADRANVAVSIWFPQNTGKVVWHPFAQALGYISNGNTTATVAPTGLTTTSSRFVLSGVEVAPNKTAGAIVAFGDSLTDGVGSTFGANKRYPDQLADKIAAANGGRLPVGVVNAGLGGNRLLRDVLGQAGVARFKRDVLGVPGVKKVIVLEGVNDIGFGFTNPAEAVTAQQLIAGYQSLIKAARAVGVKIYGATLTPFGGAFYHSPEGEAVRQAVNQWIRTARAFDGVIDFDAVLRDPANPAQLLPAYDSGDHLHMNDAGYAAMANAAYPLVRP